MLRRMMNEKIDRMVKGMDEKMKKRNLKREFEMKKELLAKSTKGEN